METTTRDGVLTAEEKTIYDNNNIIIEVETKTYYSDSFTLQGYKIIYDSNGHKSKEITWGDNIVSAITEFKCDTVGNVIERFIYRCSEIPIDDTYIFDEEINVWKKLQSEIRFEFV